ncbi:MAG: hypothetical protein QM703_02905 [Gemmatales bacterium]
MDALQYDDVVRGQFRGYRNEKGVAPDSQVETYAAVRLEINSWRWKGVPFLIRTGKCLPVSCTEVMVRFRRPPAVYSANPLPANYFRFRISPDVVIALSAQVLNSQSMTDGESVELLATERASAGRMEPYERLLDDAMEGDTMLFARFDSVEQAWRIVDPVLKPNCPVLEYAPAPGDLSKLTSCCQRVIRGITPSSLLQNLVDPQPMMKKLPIDFFRQPAIELAPALLGTILVRRHQGKIVSGASRRPKPTLVPTTWPATPPREELAVLKQCSPPAGVRTSI